MDIDLGEEIIFNVKIGSEIISLSEPTVEQVKKLGDKKDDIDSITSFIVELGMPEEVAKSLGITRIKKLMDGLIGGLSEKK